MEIPVLSMILRAGWVGRIIIIILLAFSLLTWAVIINRLLALGKIKRGNKSFSRRFAGMGAISDIENLDHGILTAPMAQLGRRGAREFKRILDDAQSHKGVKDWSFFLQNQFNITAEHMESTFSSLIGAFDKGVFLLAMVSSIAPFLGLLGTVWGIMNSFYAISNQNSASLTVVAPGIAEALITTIVGLAVAIPSLFFYNFFSHRAERIEYEMDEFKDILLARIKRDVFVMLYADQPTRPPQPGSSFGQRM